jgi:RHS repeat-associated protein
VHGGGSGGSWSTAVDARSYIYDGRGKLTDETFIYNPAAEKTAQREQTLTYGFDADDLGAVTSINSVRKTDGDDELATFYDQASGLAPFARAGDETVQGSTRSFLATGTTHGPGRFDLFLQQGNSEFEKLADVSPAPGRGDGAWQVPLNLELGSYTLQARARHTVDRFENYEVTDNVAFDITTADSRALSSDYDDHGRLTSRIWGTPDGGGNRVVQTYTWDALGHLVAVEVDDQRLVVQELEYLWVARYDGYGRRIETSYQPTGESAQILRSWFDPEVEFLEIAVEQDGERYWKLHGLDLNGAYGGQNGIGGVEAIIAQGSGSVQPLLDSRYGHIVARVDTSDTADADDDALVWIESLAGGYGMLPGSRAQSAESVGLIEALVWQGRRLDPTGLYCIGARYYSPEGGRFISADPLGHAATPDLYSYAGGDPINSLDPDGRFNMSAFQTQNNLFTSPTSFSSIRDQVYGIDPGQLMRWDAQRERREMFSQLYTFALRNFVPFGESLYQASIGNYQAAFESAFMDASFMIVGGVVGKALSSGSRIATTSYRSSSMGYRGTSSLSSPMPAINKTIPGPFSWCFPAGTMILMADGSTKPIDKIKEGDWVFADDPEDKDGLIAKQVIQLHHNWTERFIHVQIDVDGDGESDGSIRATGEHPFWTENEGWVHAKDLKKGDLFLTDEGHQPLVLFVDSIPAVEATFNLSVDGINTYFAYAGHTALLVHNAQPVTEWGVFRYGDINAKINLKDGLDGHEMLQNAWLKHHDYLAYKRDNPSLALKQDFHRSTVNPLQKNSGLWNKSNLLNQSAYDNIRANINVLKNAGVDRSVIAKQAWEAKSFANSLPCR